ncbi:rho guanine nucleotide exchange factor 3-like isoform X1 [Centruroides sculpturatus]|uniref:rho guanine nucleotide exchange factor 3-like isoform X1 n=1 Tax=Centruroides sculpturatus TaxID=218467 RepID=UPI000C6E9DCB|nr:rho guanine nucleotide exchange factor 3-like isoform X1 [Centruroides sculpturatus]
MAAIENSSMINLSCTDPIKNTTKRNASNDYNSFKQSYYQPPKRRLSCLWLETLSHATAKFMKEKLTRQELYRQEAIYELFQGENDILEDLTLVKQIYYDSLLYLEILNPDELQQIFGSFHELIPLHQTLIKNMKCSQQHDGTIQSIGEIMLNWIPNLRAYETYCSNMNRAKDALDEKKMNDKRFRDFLQRCLESPFSRKLDLWNYLDIPRNRLVKYPLLLQRILKHSPEDNIDKLLLPKAISEVEKIIQSVDQCTGQADCQFVLEKLYFVHTQQKNSFLEESSSVLCSGVLRNNRGTKLHAFLFDNGFLLSHQTTRHKNLKYKTMYQVYQNPIPRHQLVVTDIKDGSIKIGGSFRNAFTSNTNLAKNAFSVSSVDESHSSYTLRADSEHSKKQWLKKLSSVAIKFTDNRKDDDEGGFLSRPVLKQRNESKMSLNATEFSLPCNDTNHRVKTRSLVNLRLNNTVM